MKKNFLFVLSLAVSTVANAQTTTQKSKSTNSETSTNSKLSFGVKGGYSIFYEILR